jgi:hypothetical protein
MLATYLEAMRDAEVSLANVEALRRSSEEYREALRRSLVRVGRRRKRAGRA